MSDGQDCTNCHNLGALRPTEIRTLFWKVANLQRGTPKRNKGAVTHPGRGWTRQAWVAWAMALSLLPALPDRLEGQATATLRGRVVDSETGDGIGRATVRIRGLPTVTADSLGRFEVANVPVGQVQVAVQALGYTGNQWRIPFTTAQVLERQFALDFSGESLPDLVVTARANQLMPRYADFERRRERGLGAYLRWDEIKKKNFNTVGEAARSVRGVRLNCIQAEFECYLRMVRTPNCPPEWWVDGVNVRSFTENTPIRDVYGIEIYRGPGEVPGEFAGSTAGCGVIAIWTKSRPFR